jgi:hypothetical protein
MKKLNNIALSLVLAAVLAGCWTKKHHKNHKHNDGKSALDLTDTDNSPATDEKKMSQAGKPANMAQSTKPVTMADAASAAATDAAATDAKEDAAATDAPEDATASNAELALPATDGIGSDNDETPPKANKTGAGRQTAAINEALLALTDTDTNKTTPFKTTAALNVDEVF